MTCIASDSAGVIQNPIADALFSAVDVDDERILLLPYEQNLMVDTFIDDVLFIMAKGLGLERLFFNHLHLYSIPNFTVLVINTTQDDEHFYLDKLREQNPKCPPKLITADVLARDREVIYQSGGVHFITSRILMVDLLTDRIPFDCVIGILVYRAHELLAGFQESFILRLFREKKRHGFVKAFTDNSTLIAGDGIGQLQRLVSLLYVRRVVVVPRFHAEVKESLESENKKFVQMTIQLDAVQRKVQANIRDIIGACVKELKQCTKELDPISESEVIAPSATLRKTKLELDLQKRDVILTDRQQRLISDLQILRKLFHKVEDLDPTNAQRFLKWIRTNQEMIEQNSGWLFTQSASHLSSNIDTLCSLRDPQGNRTISTPPKWPVFCSILEEIGTKMEPEDSDSHVLVLVANEDLSRQLIDLIKFGQTRYTWMLTRSIEQVTKRDTIINAPPIKPIWNPTLVAHYDYQLFEKDQQNLRVQVKIAQKEITKQHRKRGKKMLLEDPKQARLDHFGIRPTAKERNNKSGTLLKRSPMNQVEKENNKQKAGTSSSSLGKLPLTKEIVPEGMLPEDPLTSFYDHEKEAKSDNSIIQLDDNPTREIAGDEERAPVRNYHCCSDEPGTSEEKDNQREFGSDEEDSLDSPLSTSIIQAPYISSCKSMLVFLEMGNNRYNLINCLETMRPKHIILYSADLASTRTIEIFRALNSDHPLELYALICADSCEEERYLSSIQKESDAIESLLKEQGILMVPREFDVSRDSVSQLRRLVMPRPDTRNRSKSSQLPNEELEAEMHPQIIVDMREFNSELPTVLYRRGIDLHAATLEVGDYVLSPDICVERKSLDDLSQSLANGRLFKQIEQMERHYSKCILLIESNEKIRSRGVRMGAFQGEMSKRGREARSLLTMLIRDHPNLHIIWSVSPAHSAEFFEELKLDQPNPQINEALKKRKEQTAAGGERPQANDVQNPDNTLPDYY